MLKRVIVFAFIFTFAQVVAARPANAQLHPEGYAFIAPSVANSFPPSGPITSSRVTGVDTGFGGELLVHNGFGAGAELSYFGPNWNFNSTGMGIASADVTYHFFPRISLVEPFVTGGYSNYFGHGSTDGYNLGGGVNIWLRKHTALRLGVRYQGNVSLLIPSVTQFTAFRIGIAFR
jgi:hypothetical protein